MTTFYHAYLKMLSDAHLDEFVVYMSHGVPFGTYETINDNTLPDRKAQAINTYTASGIPRSN